MTDQLFDVSNYDGEGAEKARPPEARINLLSVYTPSSNVFLRFPSCMWQHPRLNSCPSWIHESPIQGKFSHLNLLNLKERRWQKLGWHYNREGLQTGELYLSFACQKHRWLTESDPVREPCSSTSQNSPPILLPQNDTQHSHQSFAKATKFNLTAPSLLNFQHLAEFSFQFYGCCSETGNTASRARDLGVHQDPVTSLALKLSRHLQRISSQVLFLGADHSGIHNGQT